MRCKGQSGFTLVELMVVVLILGALAFVAIPRIGTSTQTAKINACKANIDLINSQLELFYATTGDWPENLATLTGNTTYFPDGAPTCPLSTAYAWDADTHRVEDHGHTVNN